MKSDWTTYTSAGSVGNNQASNNSSGFNAPPGGYRGVDGVFQKISLGSYWWSSM